MITIILAHDLNGNIGYKGGLPWGHIAADMNHFYHVTIGKTVVMGRNTWDSLPPKSRPLKGRKNIVITSSTVKPSDKPGEWEKWDVETCRSPYDIELRANNGEDFVIMGGKSIYEYFWDKADILIMNEIRQTYEGDIHIRDLPMERWVRETRMKLHAIGHEIYTNYYTPVKPHVKANSLPFEG